MLNEFASHSRVSPNWPSAGFRGLPNEVWWALMRSNLSGTELRITMAVVDRTLGYNRESNSISLTTFTNLTGLRRDSISNAVKKLETCHIIVVSRGSGGTANQYLFNMHYDTWAIDKQGALPLEDSTVSGPAENEGGSPDSCTGSEAKGSTDLCTIDPDGGGSPDLCTGSEAKGSTDLCTTENEGGSTKNRTSLSPTHAVPDVEANRAGSTSARTSPRDEPSTRRVNKTYIYTTIKENNIRAKSISRELFKTFWEKYPKKLAKGAAEKAFIKIGPDEGLLKTMLESIEKATLTDQWQKDKGKFIPYPATWLNQKRWEDEYSEEVNHDRELKQTRPERKPGQRGVINYIPGSGELGQ